MISKIEQKFSELKSLEKKALIPYLSCGDPTLEFTEKLVLQLEKAGADLIELGVPYSDPVADGPTIQKASQRALKSGVSIGKIFSLVKNLRVKVRIPIILMVYYNSIFRYGPEKFVSEASRAGVDGLIVPDIPVEEVDLLKQKTDANGIDLIFLVAPTSTVQRIKKITKKARGFMYCVSVTGVTGSRKEFDQGLEEFLKRVRAETDLPLAVGFGISSPETAAQVARIADGAIVGSSVIERIEKNLNDEKKAQDEVCSYLKSLRDAIDKV